jgi:hypothetical protein
MIKRIAMQYRLQNNSRFMESLRSTKYNIPFPSLGEHLGEFFQRDMRI